MKSLSFAAMLLASSAVSAQTVGVNYTNGDRQSLATQRTVLAQMAAAGVEVIRFDLEKWQGSYNASVALCKLAQSYGISTHWVVALSSNPDLYPAGTAMRPANEPGIWAAYPLSALDALLTVEALSSVLGQCPGLIAIEFGNEINNPAFNGDFPMGAAGLGRVEGMATFNSDYTAGLVAYVRALAALAPYAQVQLMSAGLYIPGGRLIGAPTGLAEDAADLNDTLTYLRNFGLGTFVSAYGIHSYPWGSLAQREEMEGVVFQQCGQDHPCAVTEWGFQVGTTQLANATQWLTAAPTGLTEELYFDWNSATWGLWHNGALTATGSLVLGWQ